MDIKTTLVRVMLAQLLAEQFRRRDEAMLAENAPHRHDEKKLIAVSQQARADLNALLREEAARLRGTEEPDWR